MKYNNLIKIIAINLRNLKIHTCRYSKILIELWLFF